MSELNSKVQKAIVNFEGSQSFRARILLFKKSSVTYPRFHEACSALANPHLFDLGNASGLILEGVFSF